MIIWIIIKLVALFLRLFLIFKNIILKGFWLSLWLNKMSIEEKNKLYSYLSELIIRKSLFTKIEKVFHINDIKEAINTASNFNRDGKILVTTSKDPSSFFINFSALSPKEYPGENGFICSNKLSTKSPAITSGMPGISYIGFLG